MNREENSIALKQEIVTENVMIIPQLVYALTTGTGDYDQHEDGACCPEIFSTFDKVLEAAREEVFEWYFFRLRDYSGDPAKIYKQKIAKMTPCELTDWKRDNIEYEFLRPDYSLERIKNLLMEDSDWNRYKFYTHCYNNGDPSDYHLTITECKIK